MAEKKNLWGGRFEKDPDRAFFEFNRSVGFDVRLLETDARASVAHCNCLEKAGVISPAEASEIRGGLRAILDRASEDPDFLRDEDAEDVHSFIEAALFEEIGETAGKLHTGRSRNDQVATAFRLFVRGAVDDLNTRARELQSALLAFAKKNEPIVFPGYTHLQKAQPVLLAHWALAYLEMLRRDRERLSDLRKRVNVSPLGSAALAGSSYPLDREGAAKELGFESITRNSLDAVSDRDFCVEFVCAASLIMAHLSRLAEDVILYTSPGFGFFELSDEVSTGSSIMPQKKNPDSMELVRGKTGRVFGDLQALLTVIKGLPLAYNKDLQEDKEPVFDAFDTTRDSLAVTETVIRGLSVNKDRCLEEASEGYLNATELADYLAKKGVPFRQAHEITGKLVLLAISRGVELQELELEEMKAACGDIDADVYDALTLEATVASKAVPGGTSFGRVKEALEEAEKYVNG